MQILKSENSNVVSLDSRNPLLVYLSALSPSGRRAMAGKLAAASKLMGNPAWPTIRFEDVARLRAAMLAEGAAPATINTTLCAVRGVAQAAWKLRQMSAEDYELIKSVESVRGEALPAGRALERRELAALFDACAADDTAAGARDAAIIALLFGCGLRRSEAVALDLGDYSPARGALTVKGKGRKERLVYLKSGAARAVADWLRVRGRKSGPLLLPVRKDGRIEERRLTDQAIYNAITKRAEQAAVAKLSPHDGRRTYITSLLDAGADISAVQKLAGHSDISTTARYDRRGETAKEKAAAKLKLPYKSRRRS